MGGYQEKIGGYIESLRTYSDTDIWGPIDVNVYRVAVGQF